jgi:hypothetical protein
MLLTGNFAGNGADESLRTLGPHAEPLLTPARPYRGG